MYTLGIEMCIKDNKRNDKPSCVCFIVTVFSIEGEGVNDPFEVHFFRASFLHLTKDSDSI